MSCPVDSPTLSTDTLDSNEWETEPMSRRDGDRPTTRTKRRFLRNSSGRLEIPYDPNLDDRSLVDEFEGLEREPRGSSSALRTVDDDRDHEAFEDETQDSQESPYANAQEHARAVAEKKAGLYIDAAKKGAVVLVLMIIPALTWLGFILMIVWGMSLGRRYFDLMVEPAWRERIVEDEVEKHVYRNVSEERRSLEGEHSRDLEELSASIAHEIRNPITAAKSLVQQMSEEPQSEDNAEYARVAVEELARVERSITHLLRFAREEEMRVDEVAMADVLDSALETFRDRAQREQVEIVRQFDTQGLVEGDPDKLRRIVINLVGNGIDALVEAHVESPRIEISMGQNLAGTEVWVRVKDNGVGIPQEIQQKIFSPFVTSKSGGTGLGLPITKKLVEAHAGTIELVSEPGEGAEFVLTIPKRAPTQSTQRSTERSETRSER